MHWFGKRNIPLKIADKELHMIRNQSLLIAGNTKQFRKRSLHGMITTRQILPKRYLKFASYLISYKSIKQLSPPPNVFPHPHLERTNNLLREPSSPPIIIFGFHYRSPQNLYFCGKTTKPLPKESSIKPN
jgi:hypothetical protein